MRPIMIPGKKYRLRQQGRREFVDGFFENNLFYEGVYPYHRVGFLDATSNHFYRHPKSLSQVDCTMELAGTVSGLILTGIAGGQYDLIEECP